MPAVRTEYYYSAIFISLLKKSIGGIGFRFLPLDSLMLVVSVTLFTFHQGVYVGMLDRREGMVAQQTVLTFDSMHASVLSQLTHTFIRSKSLCLSQ
jgi:hypothetical protein